MAAMGRLAPKLPEIDRNGMSHHGPFSRLIDCDRAIRPLLGDEGLSQSFDTDSSSIEKTGKVKIIMYVSHALGHQEVRHIELPIDTSGSKNPAQAVISTVSYGRRALTTMFFNLQSKDGDTDGNDPTTISSEQVKDLETL